MPTLPGMPRNMVEPDYADQFEVDNSMVMPTPETGRGYLGLCPCLPTGQLDTDERTLSEMTLAPFAR